MLKDSKERLLEAELHVDTDTTSNGLFDVVGVARRLNPNRVGLKLLKLNGETITLKRTGLSGDHPCGLRDGDILVFTDYGPQISWKGVFIMEYAGPLIIYPICFYFYSNDSPVSDAEKALLNQQIVALVLWSIHYLKREFETLFVHRFSADTMPLCNLFKNCLYYWVFAALIALVVNAPLDNSTANMFRISPVPQWALYVGFFLFVIGEGTNLVAHLQLAALRPEGTRERGIPEGCLFSFVSCPNYLFEFVAWLGFSLYTLAAPAALFTLVGLVQMMVWAKVKHNRYRKEFNGLDGNAMYPPDRKAMIPFCF